MKNLIILMIFLTLLLVFGLTGEHSDCDPILIFGLDADIETEISAYVGDKSWEIDTIRVGNRQTLWSTIMDDDPTLGYFVTFHTLSDTDRDKNYIWSGWRYGIVFCPFYFSGDGPPGAIRPIWLN